MNKNYGLSLMELLVVLLILSSISSSFININDYLNTLKARRICKDITYKLDTLKTISNYKGSNTRLFLENGSNLIGINEELILFKKSIEPYLAEIKTGSSTLGSITFYPKNTSSPASIKIGNNKDTFCNINISLRGRIKISYEN